MMRDFTIFPDRWGNVTVKVDFSNVPVGAWALHDFWSQIAIAALLAHLDVEHGCFRTPSEYESKQI